MCFEHVTRQKGALILRTLFRIVMALRMGVLGLLVAGIAWITLAPPTGQEARQLGLAHGSHTYQSQPLMQMRFAKAMLAFAPDRFMQKMVARSEGQMTEAQLTEALQVVADGPATGIDTGAKFVRAPSN